ncbi:MAG: SAM-dependent methyltransferase [Bradymonadia bacterium]
MHGILSWTLEQVERGRVPDVAVRAGIRRLLAQRQSRLMAGGCEARQARTEALVEGLRAGPVAVDTDAANAQHYEVPGAFFERVLGPHLKYSCCHWSPGVTDLAIAEAEALQITCERAELADGMRILELGCGWGSLSLWMAEHYPDAQITAVSNSSGQRAWITAEAQRRGLDNLTLVTADMNTFEAPATDHGRGYDRVISIEMFEHMRNWPALMQRISTWLAPGGRLFTHVFCHRDTPYIFEDSGPADWMSRHFFTGGLMPSDDLFHRFQDDLRLVRRWRWSGVHYQKTAEAWLARMDAAHDTLTPVLEAIYTEDVERWRARWRVFFMACAELFGDAEGERWWVGHYLFERP